VMFNVFVTFGAGSGSSYIVRKVGGSGNRDDIAKRGTCHMRADVMFDSWGENAPKLDNLNSFPVQRHKTLFDARVNGFYSLDLKKSIDHNMVEYIKLIQAQDKIKTVLTGKLSILGPFFTYNNIKNVLGIIRHPLHNIAAAWIRRYPNMPERYFGPQGTLYSEEAIALYSKWWCRVVQDLLDSGNPILRYEYVTQEMEKLDLSDDPITKDMLQGWKWIRKHFILPSKLDSFFKDSVADQYFKLYDKWEL